MGFIWFKSCSVIDSQYQDAWPHWSIILIPICNGQEYLIGGDFTFLERNKISFCGIKSHLVTIKSPLISPLWSEIDSDYHSCIRLNL